MRTKEMLGMATAANAAKTIEHAQRLGWSEVSMRRHGNAAILKALDGPKPRKVRQGRQASYESTPQKRAVATGRPVKEQDLTVNVLYNGKTRVALLAIDKARPKKLPDTGVTHDATLVFVGDKRDLHNFTLSVTAARRVVGGERIGVWLRTTKRDPQKHEHLVQLAQ